ncbi:MAG: hypothetical protein KDB53_20305 [Planctomycetes bacterium]|nr:hypothetical protein [Planctomycetota bacterium]
MLEWIRSHEGLVWALGIGSGLTFVGSLLAIPWIIARLPVDRFQAAYQPPFRKRHPLLHVTILVVKNLVGGLLVVAGVAMLVLPGQGLLTMLIGLGLLDLPGKHRFERKLFDLRVIRKALNWLRRRAGRPEFRFDEPDS